MFVRIKVTIKTNSKVTKVEKTAKNEYKVWVVEPAKENKANMAMIKALSEYLNISKSSIDIVHGLKSKQKILEI